MPYRFFQASRRLGIVVVNIHTVKPDGNAATTPPPTAVTTATDP
jgi:hypothetical protein